MHPLGSGGVRLVHELAGPSGNMGFGWGKQRNNVQCPVASAPASRTAA